jgi:hypothetical protein
VPANAYQRLNVKYQAPGREQKEVTAVKKYILLRLLNLLRFALRKWLHSRSLPDAASAATHLPQME